MQGYKHSVSARPDTMLGVCQALGEDFGFNPLILRLALAVPLVWMPVPIFAAYAALGLLVLVSRLLFPNPRPVFVQAEVVALQTIGHEPVTQPMEQGHFRVAA